MFVLETRFNSGINFLLSLIENLTFIYENVISSTPVPIVMSENDFKKSNNCHICNTPLLLDKITGNNAVITQSLN